MPFEIPTQPGSLQSWEEQLQQLNQQERDRLLYEIRQLKDTFLYKIFSENKRYIAFKLNYSIIESLGGQELQAAIGELRAEVRNWSFYEEVELELLELIEREQQEKEEQEQGQEHE